MDLNRHIWEGWTPQDFIDNLEVTFPYQTFNDEEELKKWCKSEQPHYKKHIPEVYAYFLEMSYKLSKFDNPKRKN